MREAAPFLSQARSSPSERFSLASDGLRRAGSNRPPAPDTAGWNRPDEDRYGQQKIAPAVLESDIRRIRPNRGAYEPRRRPLRPPT